MTSPEDVVRRAYEAYAQGDLAAMLSFINTSISNGPISIPQSRTPERRWREN